LRRVERPLRRRERVGVVHLGGAVDLSAALGELRGAALEGREGVARLLRGRTGRRDLRRVLSTMPTAVYRPALAFVSHVAPYGRREGGGPGAIGRAPARLRAYGMQRGTSFT
jgi:hypothetical protein